MNRKTYLLLLFLFLSPLVLRGQAQASEDSTAQAIVPIAPTDVPQYVESNKQLILSVGKDLMTPQSVNQIILELPGQDSVVQAAIAKFDSAELSLYTLDQLSKSEAGWRRLLDKLVNWSKIISDRLDQLNKRGDEVDVALKTLDATLESFTDQSIPETISSDIIQSEEELGLASDSLSVRMALLLTVKSTESQLINKINERQSRIAVQREELLRNIFSPETQPLWRMARDSSDFRFFEGVSSRVQVASQHTKTYFQNNPVALFLTPLFFLLVISTLLYYKYWLKRHKEGPDLEGSAISLVLKWPIFSSLLLTWLFLTFSFRDLPIEARNMVAMVMLIPLSVILYGLLDRKLYWVVIFGVFFLFDLVYPATVDSPFAQRVTLLIFGLGSLAVITWLLYKGAASRLVGWGWFVTFILQLAALVVLGSLVSNLVGSVQLSELLLLGTTGSVVVAISLYAIAYLLVALISVILTLPLFQRSIMIRNYQDLLMKRAERILYFVALLWWADNMFTGFRVDKEVYAWINGIFEVSWQIGSLSLSPGDMLAFVLTLLVSIWASRFIRFFLQEEVFQRTKLPKGVGGTITMLIRYAMITLGFLLAIAAAGIQLDKLAIIMGALGVGIGFGLQDIINNLISGIILAVERPVQVGDVVQVDELMGIVMDIGFRASKVRTYEGSEVIVPNGHLVSKQMINWTLSDTKRRLKVDIGVAFGTDPQTVLDLMAAAANDHEEILKDPAPRPRFMGFGDSALEFQLLYWIPDFDDGFRLGTEMTLAVHKKITEAGITIPFPQRDLHVISKEKDRPKEIEELIKASDSERSSKPKPKTKKEAPIPAEPAGSKEGFDVDGE